MIRLKKNSWSDGKSAFVFALGAAVIIPVMVVRREENYIQLLPIAFLLVLSMGYFWSAIWKTNCHDIWAWAALTVGLLTIFGICASIVLFWPH